jgi:lipoprotein-anchoring transpeptidase ErfK/SrfK
MPDYYSALSRALQQGDSENAQWRLDIYGRTRQMLLRKLRAQRPPLSEAEIRLYAAPLEAAIKQIESEFLQAHDGGGALQDDLSQTQQDEHARGSSIIPDQSPAAAPIRIKRASWMALAVVVAAVAAGACAFWATRPHVGAPQAVKNEPVTAAPVPIPRASAGPSKVALIDGDLTPGIDGGSSDAELPYAFRRQPVFYRTTHPVGTILVDEPQHFLYLIQPNLVALRYGIGLGAHCADLAGLRRVSGKTEWPQWQPPADMVARKLTPPGIFPGRPGNPLGARVLDLDDGNSRIHGTNAPKTIGSSVAFGCIRLVNDDIVDLYNRVSIGARVILGN